MTRKRFHKLTRTKSVSRPQNIIFVDTETNETRVSETETYHTLKLGVAQYYRYNQTDTLRLHDEIVFYTTTEFYEFTLDRLRKKAPAYIVAHNWNFDAPILHVFTEWINNGFELTQWYTNSGVSIFRFSHHRGNVVLVDNLNFFKGSLKSLSNIVNLPKLVIDFQSDTDEYLIEYCKRDVEIMVELWKQWLSFLDEHDLGSFQLTLASTAFNAFRYRFMSNTIYVHNNEQATDLERDSYHGGRVEALYRGEHTDNTYYLLDINSMYPSVMKNNPIPIALNGHNSNPTLKSLTNRLKDNLCIARVTINTDINPYPAKHDGRLIFPTGEFITTLCTPELHYALSLDHITDIHELAWYESSDLFADFVTFFYGLRKQYKTQGNKPYDFITKIIQNSLYGKFGQWSHELKHVDDCDVNLITTQHQNHIDTNTYITLTSIAGKVWMSYKGGEAYNSFPAVAAHVTAYGRMQLYGLIQLAGKQNCYYCDTDSVMVNERGYNNLKFMIDQTELGALKLEKKAHRILINAPKDYVMDDQIKRKGVRYNAEHKGNKTYTQDKFSSIRGMIRRGNLEQIRIERIQKTLKHSIYGHPAESFGWLSPPVLEIVDHQNFLILFEGE